MHWEESPSAVTVNLRLGDVIPLGDVGADEGVDAFTREITNAYPGKDYDDLMAGVDTVLGRGTTVTMTSSAPVGVSWMLPLAGTPSFTTKTQLAAPATLPA